MLADDTFNEAIGAWDTSSVTDMSELFYGASAFNQDIGAWDVSKVTSMLETFAFASTFNADISAWNVSPETDMDYAFTDSGLQHCPPWAVGKNAWGPC